MPSWSEWHDSQAEPRLRAHEARLAHEQTRRLVVLRMEDLLASDDWGAYALHLDALIGEAEAAVALLQAQILGDAVGDELAKLKGQAKHAQGRLEGLREARALPERLRTPEKELTGENAR